MKANRHLLATIVTILMLCTGTFFFTGGNNTKEALAAPSEVPGVVQPPTANQSRETRIHAIQDTLKWDRDPFVLPPFLMTEKKEKERVPLKLLAIMEGARGRVAIIENEIVRKGDTVAGEKVI